VLILLAATSPVPPESAFADVDGSAHGGHVAVHPDQLERFGPEAQL